MGALTTPIIKILLIGDYSIFRNALRMLLETDKRLRVVGESSRFEVAAEIVAEESPDLIVVDLPDFGGDDILPLFQNSKIPVLVLVGRHDVGIYKRCLRIGISGLILKEVGAEMLFKAIEKIYSGEIWFDRTIMGETLRQLILEKQIIPEYPRSTGGDLLTDRERQVVQLICKGMKNKGIAERLRITETTVRHHLTSVFNKLEISSRLELVIYAFNNNFVTGARANGNGSRTGNGSSRRRPHLEYSVASPVRPAQPLDG